MVRIIFLNPPSFIPSHYADSDGSFSLDLNKAERIALTRVIDDYIDVGELRQDTFKELEIPITKKNRLLLGQIGNPSALNENNNKIFDIQLLKGDFSYPVSGLQLVNVKEEQEQSFYSVVIFGELNDWYRPMNNLFLDEIELGSEVVDEVFLNTLHNFNFNYEDTDYPVFPPLVNYGSWFINCNVSSNEAESQVVFNDYRFFHSPLAVLRQAFCQVGYRLVAPMFEQEEFRRQWCYLLDPNFETANQDDVADRPIEVDRTTNSTLAASFFVYSSGNTENGVILFPNVVSDPGSHFIFQPATAIATDNYFGSFYSGGIIGNFNFNGTVRLRIVSGTLIPVQPDFVTLTVSIRKSFKYGVEGQTDFLSKATTLASKKVIFDTGFFIGGVNVDTDFVLDTGTIKTYEHELIFVQLELEATLVDGGGVSFDETIFYSTSGVLSGAKFECTVQQQVIEKGDTISFGKLMRKDKTALQLLKGIVHLPSMKIETDTINKVVSIYPEFKFDWYKSGTQEGFFKENTDDALDATLAVQTKSMTQSFRNTDLAREVYLKFLDSTDGFISRQNLEQELHSKKIDLGPNYRDGENRIENPFFEPTDVDFDNKIGGLNLVIGPSDIRASANMIPFMWETEPSEDNIYPEKGFDYTPRILIAYKLASTIDFEPELTGQQDVTFSFFVFEDVAQPFYNLCGQIFPSGIVIKKVGDPDEVPDLAVVYGNGVNPLIEDNFGFVYERSINQAYFGISLEFLVLISLLEFSDISFRQKWRVKYNSEAWGQIDFYARLSRVSDFVIGENLTTPIELIPDSNNFENCLE